MFYFFALIFLCWGLAYYFLSHKGGEKRIDKLRTAQAELDAASTPEDRRAAALQVLEVLERNEMFGVVADDARKAAELVLAKG